MKQRAINLISRRRRPYCRIIMEYRTLHNITVLGSRLLEWSVLGVKYPSETHHRPPLTLTLGALLACWSHSGELILIIYHIYVRDNPLHHLRIYNTIHFLSHHPSCSSSYAFHLPLSQSSSLTIFFSPFPLFLPATHIASRPILICDRET